MYNGLIMTLTQLKHLFVIGLDAIASKGFIHLARGELRSKEKDSMFGDVLLMKGFLLSVKRVVSPSAGRSGTCNNFQVPRAQFFFFCCPKKLSKCFLSFT